MLYGTTGYHSWLKVETKSSFRLSFFLLLGWINPHLVDRFGQLAIVPPEHLAVGGRREELGAALGLDPGDLVRRVAVTVGQYRPLDRCLTAPDVPQGHLAVILAADDEAHVLGGVAKTADREIGRQRRVRLREIL